MIFTVYSCQGCNTTCGPAGHSTFGLCSFSRFHVHDVEPIRAHLFNWHAFVRGMSVWMSASSESRLQQHQWCFLTLNMRRKKHTLHTFQHIFVVKGWKERQVEYWNTAIFQPWQPPNFPKTRRVLHPIPSSSRSVTQWPGA